MESEILNIANVHINLGQFLSFHKYNGLFLRMLLRSLPCTGHCAGHGGHRDECLLGGSASGFNTPSGLPDGADVVDMDSVRDLTWYLPDILVENMERRAGWTVV